MKIKPNCILIFVIDKNENILLLNRENEPAKGTWCGVGGHIENNEGIVEETRNALNFVINKLGGNKDE